MRHRRRSTRQDPRWGPGLAQVPDIVVDAGGAWKLFLARDLRRAGIQLDISRAAADL